MSVESRVIGGSFHDALKRSLLAAWMRPGSGLAKLTRGIRRRRIRVSYELIPLRQDKVGFNHFFDQFLEAHRCLPTQTLVRVHDGSPRSVSTSEGSDS